jgi:ribosomal protein L40E
MANKTVGYVDLEWTCPSCGARNPGSKKSCQTCGTVMPENMQFELPAKQELDTSAETAARVAAGPDIHCPYCGARNAGDAKVCSQCGGDLSEGARRAAGKVLGALETGPVPDVICPHCGKSNPATATKCSSCGGTLEKAPPPKEPSAEAPKKRFPTWLIGVILIALLGCCAAVYLLTRGSSQSVGVVKDVQWTYTIEIEQLTPVTREAWRDQVPAGAQVAKCERRVRRTVSDPVPGATEVCGTPYVVDTGTGKGKVVKDCQYQVTDDWCQYSATEWQATSPRVATGRDFNPTWPTLSLRSDQREHGRVENYKVVFMVNDKSYNYSPSKLQDFRQFQLGSKWTIKTNVLGGVTVVEPAK